MQFDVAGALKAGASPDEIAQFLAEKRGFDLEGALGAGASVDQVIGFLSKRPERSWGEAAKDTAVQLAEGVNTMLGAVPSLVAPDSSAAEFFKNNADYWRGQQSDPLKQRIADADRAISAAGEDGVTAQIAEAASQYFDDPALAARFVVTNLPSMIPGIGTAKLAQAAAVAKGLTAAKAASVATTVAGATNAVLNAGGARGEAFDDIKQTLVKQGLSEEEATEQALRDSRVAAAVGGLAGFASGKIGLEGAIVGRAAGTGAARAFGGGLIKEMAGEQLEEVAPKLTTNALASQYDGRSLGQDVGRTIVETAVGAGPGAVVAGGFDASAAASRRRMLDAKAQEDLNAATNASEAAAAANQLADVDLDAAISEVEQSINAYLQPGPLAEAQPGLIAAAQRTPEQILAEVESKRAAAVQRAQQEMGIALPEAQPPGDALTPQQKQELVRQQMQAEPVADPLGSLRLQTQPNTTMADVAQRRDAVETSAIERLLAADQPAPVAAPAAAPAPDLRQASAQESGSNMLAGQEQQTRQRMVDTLVENLAEPSGYFASRMIPAIDKQLGVLNQPPLTEQERARVANLAGTAQTFTSPNLPQGPEPVLPDTGADNSSMEALIKPLSKPTNGAIVTAKVKFSSARAMVPGTVDSLTDSDGSTHQFTVADSSKLGSQGRLIKQIARVFGKQVVVFDSDTMQADGFVREGDNRNIYINARSQISPVAVFGHELTHLMKRENAKAYAALETVVKRNLSETGMQEFTEEYGAGADLEELSSDLVGNRFREAKFWTQVFDEIAAQNPEEGRSIIQRVGQALRKAIEALLNTIRQPGFNADSYVKNLEEINDAVKTAMVQYAQQQRTATIDDTAPQGAGNAKFTQSRGDQGVPESATADRRVAGQDGGGQVPEYGTARQGAISVVGRHYSTQTRSALNGAYYGQGLKGAERERLANSPDPRLRSRVYFYVDQGSGIRPEAGVGGYAHEVRLNNIYDPSTQLIKSSGDPNAFESAVLNAGFDGYIAPFGNNQAAVVLLGPKHNAVPVKAIGQVASAAAPQAVAPSTLKKGLLSKEANALDVNRIPGARLRMGNLEIPADQTDAANAELERIGSDTRFSAARRGGVAEEVGEFKIRTQKDGTMGVAGDVEAIRALLPEGVKGRPVPGGLLFTTSDAPRVRAALEGRKLAYSRAGQVLDKLPMKDGKYVGAPEKYNTPGKITALRNSLRKLTLEGERGRFWYENSSRAVLEMTGGNVQEARKFVALLAIYSPQAKVDANSTFALRAWAQYKAGQPISVKTGVMDKKAQAALDDVDAFWSGEKTGNFFFNLLREIDPSTAGKQGATIDMWMARAFEYDTDIVPSGSPKYAFAENETNRIAAELGWEPQQVQAAIWVAMKARMENAGVKKRTEATSEKKGWIRFDYPLKNGRPVKTRVILDAQAHRDNWLKHAFAHDPTKDDTEQAKFDFSDGVRRHIGQLSWEARPGRSTNVLPGVNDAPYEQQVEFQQAVQKALLDDTGVDLLAYKLGLLVDGPDILAPGVWQGEIAAGMQKRVAMAPAKGDDGKSSVDPAQKQALEVYAATLGLLLRQEGVGYHRPFYSGKKSAENGVNLDIGRTFTPDEAQALWGAIDSRMKEAGVSEWENGAGLISSPTGMRVVNFGAFDDNGQFRALVKDAASTLTVDEIAVGSFTSDGDLVFNDWKESPNGEDYRQRIAAAGSPDLLDWARDVLAPRVQSVFNEFSSKYGWGNPGDTAALFDGGQAQEGLTRFSRKRNALGYYSALARGVEGIKATSAPAAGWKDAIKGLVNKGQAKQEEVTWSGVEDWLSLQQGKVTKDQVIQFLDQGGVQVEETVLGARDVKRVAEDVRLFEERHGVQVEWELDNGITGLYDSDGNRIRVPRNYLGIEGMEDYAELEEAIVYGYKSDTKYSEYTLPGGENYREVLLTLPVPSMAEIEPWTAGRMRSSKDKLLEMGFSQLAIDIAIAKADETGGVESAQRAMDSKVASGTASQGQREALQLLRGMVSGERKNKAARLAELSKVTYKSSHWDQRNVIAHIRVNDRTDADGKRVLFVEELQSDWGQEGKKKGFKGAGLEVRKITIPNPINGLGGNTAQDAMDSMSIPAAPFVTKTDGWLTLGLKRVIAMAVEGGYDAVAFVNGEQSADRYDLSKQVSRLEWKAKPGAAEGSLLGWDAYGDNVVDKAIKADEVEDYVGKEVAKRLLESPVNHTKASGAEVRRLEGVGLKVGGEGMKAFYDSIVPNAVKSLLKKLKTGAELRQVQIEDLLQPGFDVTPQLRAAASEGLPLFSRRRNIYGQPVAATWTAPTETKLDDFLYVMQDKMIDTRRVVEEIKKAAGGLADKWNAYLQEELFHGRTAKETKNFLLDELRPLLQDMQARGVAVADFEEYLHNRHAEERNRQIAKVNPNMPDGGSGIDTADARNYLASLDPVKRRAYEALAKRVDAITANTRKLLVSSGLEKPDTIAAWEGAYSQYVPLNREDLDFSSSFGSAGTGQGFSVKGASSKRATGSGRPVVDILANVAMQRERAIVRSEKNRVAQALFGLATTQPNTDFWLAVNPDAIKDPAALQAELINIGLNPKDAEGLIQEPKQTYIDPRTGLVAQRINPVLRSSPNVLAVRIEGQDRYVFFNANDPRSERMVAALKNLDADQLGRLMGMSAQVTRFFASVNTQYNPIFGAINFLRDVQGAAMNLSTTPIADRKAQVMADTIPALRGIYADLRAERRGGQRPTGTWATLWEEFQREGGQTGYRDQFSRSAERAEALEKELKRISEGKAMQAGRAVFDWLSDYNETMENAVRLAAYKAAKDKGLSNQQAASVAKNLTVNFNRKGQVATQAGALYAFFNAAVQGTTRLTETLRGPAGKKIMAGGLLLGAVQAVMLAAAGFDDDEPPEFARERNLIIPIGGSKYLSVPLPLGFHVIPNTSRILTEFVLSGFRDPSKRVGQIVSALFEAFNPIGSAGWSVQTIAPTFADPLVALKENRDWTGKPIAKEDRSSTDPTPGYTRAKETASWFAKELSYYLNLASGGTKYKPGMVSPTPDQIDYLIGQVTGGVGRELLKVEQTITSQVTGEELPTYKVPLVGRFYGDAKSSSAESTKFYANITRLNEHENEIQGRRKNREDAAGYIRENPEARLVPFANQIERDVQELRKRRRELLEKGASKESVQIIETRITNRMRQLNDRVRGLREKETAE